MKNWYKLDVEKNGYMNFKNVQLVIKNVLKLYKCKHI